MNRNKYPGVYLQWMVPFTSDDYRKEKSFTHNKINCLGRRCLEDRAAWSLTNLKITLFVSLVS